MPFRQWQVEPVYLSRKPLPEGKSISDELEAVANSTLVGSLRQLACLLQLARHVFQGITAECQLVHQRAERLHTKVQQCEGFTVSLDAKSVSVPVGSLEQYSQVTQHYGTKYDQTSQLFQEPSRPDCVRDLYKDASATPVPIIRTIDRYRTDGRTGSKLFMVTPVFGDEEKKKKNENLDIETRRPASFALARDWQEDEEFSLPDETRLAWLVSPSSERMSRGNADKSLVRLPSPEERMHALSLGYPSTVVPVDISGSSLHRLFGLRRSLIHADFIIKRKKRKKTKRRNTIAEGSSKELQEAVKNSRELVHTSCQTEELDEIFPAAKTLPSRRTFFFRKKDGSLPKDLSRNSYKENHGQESAAVSSAAGPKVVDKKAEACEQDGGGRKADKSSAKSRVRSFIPISTLSTAMTVAVKLRQSSSRAGGKTGDDGRSSSGNWSGSSSTRASVDSDHQQASASPDGACSPSRSSLGKDSVLSDYTHQDIDGRSQDDTLTGYNSETSTSAAGQPHGQISKSSRDTQVEDSSSWLQTTDQGTQSSTSTPENYPSDTTSTPQVLSPFLIRKETGGSSGGATSPQPSPGLMDDGDSSVYSVDTDGYYTSMHTDSGLWSRSGHRHADRSRVRRGSQSSVSTVGNGSLNSFLSRTAIEGSSANGSLKKKRIPPRPPPRVSSIFKPSAKIKDVENEEEKRQDGERKKAPGSDSSESSLPLNGEVSTSDSDHDVGERIKEKTTINSSRYPSMCAVSPETSDDDDRLGKGEQPSSARVDVVTVAEIHQEEKPEDYAKKVLESAVKHYSSSSNKPPEESGPEVKGQQHKLTSHSVEKSSLQRSAIPSRLNMYCDSYPQNSTFSSVLNRNSSKSPSPEKQPLASFSPIHHPTSPPPSFYNAVTSPYSSRHSTIPGQFHGDRDRIIVSGPPVDSHSISPQEEKSLIPLKYAQHITVTPKFRELSPTSPSSPTRKVPTSPTSPLSPLNSTRLSGASDSSFRYPSSRNGHSIQSHIPRCLSPVANSPSPRGPVQDFQKIPPIAQSITTGQSRRPMSHLPRSTSFTATSEKSMARVTLDPSGKVIYASNSLGRRRSGHSVSNEQPNLSQSPQNQKFATLPLRQSLASQLPSAFSSGASNSDKIASSQLRRPYPSQQTQTRSSLPAPQVPNGNPQRKDPSFRIIRYDSSPTRYGNNSPPRVPQSRSSSSIYATSQNNRSSIPKSGSALSFTSEQAFLKSPVSAQPTNYSPLTTSQSLTAWKNDMRRAFFNTPVTSAPQTAPHSSSYPSHAVPRLSPISPHTSTSSAVVSSQSKCSLPAPAQSSSPPPQAVPNGNALSTPCDPSLQENRRKPISAAELFAIIHKSKKRHNIKSDSESFSSPMSSRSSSPSVGRPSTPSKGALAETGFLTPRSNTSTPNNRHSWVGDSSTPVNGTGLERRSLVQDRLGPSRPTSMHDFKMLLLQTRSTMNADRSQKSAAELLKTSAPRKTTEESEQTMSQSLPTSPVKSVSVVGSLPQSSAWSGHSTVPMKRGARIRSSLQPRYDLAYPPIWEDCSEEGELHRDQQNYHPDAVTSPSSAGTNQKYFHIFQQGASPYSQENRVPKHHENDARPAPVTSTWV